MDRKSVGLIPYLKFPPLLLWLMLSTVLYAILTIAISLISKRTAHHIAKLWCRQQLFMAGIKIKVSGAEKIERGRNYMFFANHQSALDIPVLYAGISLPLCFIAKRELFLIPFFGWGIWALGHVQIDRSSPRKARDSLARGVVRLKKHCLSLILFPEGTRSVDGKLSEFKQGSFALALEAGVPVIPVAIRKANECLPKKSLIARPGTVFLDICEPIDPAGMEKRELAAAVRGEIEKIIES